MSNRALPAAAIRRVLVIGKILLDPLVDLSNRQTLIFGLLYRHEDQTAERQRGLVAPAAVSERVLRIRRCFTVV